MLSLRRLSTPLVAAARPSLRCCFASYVSGSESDDGGLGVDTLGQVVKKLDTLREGDVRLLEDVVDDVELDAAEIARVQGIVQDVSNVEFYDGEGTVMEGKPKSDVLPRLWSYRALMENKIPGSAPPPNPYNAKVEYVDPARLVSSKTNPVKHTAADAALGRQYDIPEDTALFPEGLAGDLEEHFAVTGGRRLLIPPVGVDIVQGLERFRVASQVDSSASTEEQDAQLKAAFSEFRPFVMLDGPRGVGKSVALNYAVHYARANGWLCLFIPDVFSIMRDGMVVTPSRRTPGMFDQHDMAMAIIQNTLTAHSELLGTLPQQGVYTKDRYLPADLDAIAVKDKETRFAEETERRRRARAEAEAQGKTFNVADVARDMEETSTEIDRSQLTLKDMLEWAVAHPPSATDTLLDFKQELANVTEVPVLVAIDGMQNAYHPTESYPWEGRYLTPEELTIPSELQMLRRNGTFRRSHKLKRGVVLTTVSYKHEPNPIMMSTFHRRKLPATIRLDVPNMERPQVYSMLHHLQATHRFNMLRDPSDVTGDAVEFYRVLTDGRPKELCSTAMLLV